MLLFFHIDSNAKAAITAITINNAGIMKNAARPHIIAVNSPISSIEGNTQVNESVKLFQNLLKLDIYISPKHNNYLVIYKLFLPLVNIGYIEVLKASFKRL